MKTLIVYESGFGNTAAVADRIAEGLGDVAGTDVAVVPVAEAPTSIDPDLTLVVVGGPTHAFSMSRESTRRDGVKQGGHDPGTGIREWLGELSVPYGQRFACFDTRVGKVRHLPGSAARSAARLVRHRKLGRLVDVRSFFVGDVAGPLLDGELDRARAWGSELAAKLDAPAAGRS
jgi:hypothetical protein